MGAPCKLKSTLKGIVQGKHILEPVSHQEAIKAFLEGHVSMVLVQSESEGGTGAQSRT